MDSSSLELLTELLCVGLLLPLLIFFLKRFYVDHFHTRALQDKYPARKHSWKERIREKVWGNELGVLSTGVLGSMAIASPASVIQHMHMLTPQAKLCTGLASLIVSIVAWFVLERVLCKLPHGGEEEEDVTISKMGLTVSIKAKHLVVMLNLVGLALFLATVYFVIGGRK